MERLKVLLITLISINLLIGCQGISRDYGGSTTINLEPNQKLELITWKGTELWYLTRPMRKDEEPEVHVYKQSKDLGILEGEVKIVESKE